MSYLHIHQDVPKHKQFRNIHMFQNTGGYLALLDVKKNHGLIIDEAPTKEFATSHNRRMGKCLHCHCKHDEEDAKA